MLVAPLHACSSLTITTPVPRSHASPVIPFPQQGSSSPSSTASELPFHGLLWRTHTPFLLVAFSPLRSFSHSTPFFHCAGLCSVHTVHTTPSNTKSNPFPHPPHTILLPRTCTHSPSLVFWSEIIIIILPPYSQILSLSLSSTPLRKHHPPISSSNSNF
jgi:hypothetical protein